MGSRDSNNRAIAPRNNIVENGGITKECLPERRALMMKEFSLKKTIWNKNIVIVLICLSLASDAVAQNGGDYEISWSTIDGGGGKSIYYWLFTIVHEVLSRRAGTQDDFKLIIHSFGKLRTSIDYF